MGRRGGVFALGVQPLRTLGLVQRESGSSLSRVENRDTAAREAQSLSTRDEECADRRKEDLLSLYFSRCSHGSALIKSACFSRCSSAAVLSLSWLYDTLHATMDEGTDQPQTAAGKEAAGTDKLDGDQEPEHSGREAAASVTREKPPAWWLRDHHTLLAGLAAHETSCINMFAEGKEVPRALAPVAVEELRRKLVEYGRDSGRVLRGDLGLGGTTPCGLPLGLCTVASEEGEREFGLTRRRGLDADRHDRHPSDYFHQVAEASTAGSNAVLTLQHQHLRHLYESKQDGPALQIRVPVTDVLRTRQGANGRGGKGNERDGKA